MLLNIVVVFLTGLLSLVFADTTYSTTTSTFSSAVATHTIAVGAVRGLPIVARLFRNPNAHHIHLLGRGWI